jgi:hypothetical protein
MDHRYLVPICDEVSDGLAGGMEDLLVLKGSTA